MIIVGRTIITLVNIKSSASHGDESITPVMRYFAKQL